MARTTALNKIESALYEPTFYKVIQGGACFPAGTKVLLSDGTHKEIEKLQSGDKVLSRDFTGSVITTEVAMVWYAGNSKPMITIEVGGEKVKATYDHKFYSAGKYEELYKIAWGKMEAGQRLQLQLLCKQYGAHIDIECAQQEEQSGCNEALLKLRPSERCAWLYADRDGQEKCKSPQSSSPDMGAKSAEQAFCEPYQWKQGRQQGRKPGMGDNFGEPAPRLSDRPTQAHMGGEKPQSQANRKGCQANQKGMGRGQEQVIKERVRKEIQCQRINHQRCLGEPELEKIAIDKVWVSEPEEVYSLEIDHPSHNYFVGDQNINVSNSAGKTFAILTLLVGYCQSYPDSLVTVVGLSYPHLEAGSIRDFIKILKEVDGWEEERWNKSAKTYAFPNGSILEFKSIDHMSARGPRRDALFVNEANGITFETFQELSTRTKDVCIIDYNPSSRFWANDELVEKMPEDTTFLVLTYKDNEALSKREIANIESHKPKPGEEPSNWWVVYGLGQIGSLEGNVYKNWIAEPKKPDGYILKRYGVDFGFSNDPTAVIAVYENEAHEIFAETMIYEKGLLTPELIEKMKKLEPALAVCDNARPEIIAEMRRSGLRAIGCDKTPGEKMNGKRYNIELVQRRIVHYLKSDKDLEKEYLSYAWRKKRSTGEWLDEPEDGNDHDVDALSYAIRDMVKKRIEF